MSPLWDRMRPCLLLILLALSGIFILYINIGIPPHIHVTFTNKKESPDASERNELDIKIYDSDPSELHGESLSAKSVLDSTHHEVHRVLLGDNAAGQRDVHVEPVMSPSRGKIIQLAADPALQPVHTSINPSSQPGNRSTTTPKSNERQEDNPLPQDEFLVQKDKLFGKVFPSVPTVAGNRSTTTPQPHTTQKPQPLVSYSESQLPVPKMQISAVNCTQMFEGNRLHKGSFERAERLQKASFLKSRFLTPREIYTKAVDCKTFIEERQYVMDSITQEEADFPIAYSIVMYYAVGQAERLLRAIYRPQNYYCFHVDSKAGLEVELSMQRLAACFDNVFIAENPASVEWAYYGVLESELICMRQLAKYKKWKYFINLTGHEFPLKSNYEIVQILKTYNGSNEISNLPIGEFSDRWNYVHVVGRGRTAVRKTPPPHNITIHKGDAHVTLSRAFVDYILNDPVPLEFAEWMKNVYCPEETYFSSLQYNSHLKAPGTLRTDDMDTSIVRYQKVISRHKVWATEGRTKCKSGYYRHMICIYGLKDLGDLARDYKAMFINKLLEEYQPFTYDCLEELFFNRTRDEYLGRKGVDMSYYARRPFVHHHW